MHEQGVAQPNCHRQLPQPVTDERASGEGRSRTTQARQRMPMFRVQALADATQQVLLVVADQHMYRTASGRGFTLQVTQAPKHGECVTAAIHGIAYHDQLRRPTRPASAAIDQI